MSTFRPMSWLVKGLFAASIVSGIVTVVLIFVGFAVPELNSRPGVVPTFIFITIALVFVTYLLGGWRRRL